MAAFGLVAILVLTLGPSSGSAALPFWCLTCGTRPGVDLALNMVLFAPLGLGLGIVGFRLGRALLLMFAITLSVEVLQYLIIAGRDASLRDVLANTLGGGFGCWIGVRWMQLVRPSPHAARRLRTVGAVAWLVAQAFTAWAFGLVEPPPPWWAQIRPRHDRFPAVFAGDVLALAVGDSPIVESDRLPDPDRIRRELEEGNPVRATVTVLGASKGVAPILIISAGPSRDVSLLAQDGRDALFQIYVRGAAAGLRHPLVRLADAFPAEGDTVILAASLSAGVYRVSSRTAIRMEERLLPVSASWGWSLVLPLPAYAFGSEVRLVTAMCLLVWFVVFGFWGGWVENGSALSRRIPELVVLLVVGLAVIPVVFAIPVSHWSEWFSAAGGATVGWSLGRRVSSGYRKTPGTAARSQDESAAGRPQSL